MEKYALEKPMYFYKGETIEELIPLLCNIIPETINLDGSEEVVGYIVINDLSNLKSLPEYIGYHDILFGWQFIINEMILEDSKKISRTFSDLINEFIHIVYPNYEENNFLIELFVQDLFFDLCISFYRNDNYVDALFSALKNIYRIHTVPEYIKNFQRPNIREEYMRLFLDTEGILSNSYSQDIIEIIYENKYMDYPYICFTEETLDLYAAAYKTFCDNVLQLIDFNDKNEEKKLRLILEGSLKRWNNGT